MSRPSPRARSDSRDHAAVESGCDRTTSTGSVPASSSSAPGSGGNSVSGGSPSRLVIDDTPSLDVRVRDVDVARRMRRDVAGDAAEDPRDALDALVADHDDV